MKLFPGIPLRQQKCVQSSRRDIHAIIIIGQTRDAHSDNEATPRISKRVTHNKAL